LQERLRLPNHLTAPCHKLIRDLLAKDASERARAGASLRDQEFFNGLDWAAVLHKAIPPPFALSKELGESDLSNFFLDGLEEHIEGLGLMPKREHPLVKELHELQEGLNALPEGKASKKERQSLRKRIYEIENSPDLAAALTPETFPAFPHFDFDAKLTAPGDIDWESRGAARGVPCGVTGLPSAPLDVQLAGDEHVAAAVESEEERHHDLARQQIAASEQANPVTEGATGEERLGDEEQEGSQDGGSQVVVAEGSPKEGTEGRVRAESPTITAEGAESGMHADAEEGVRENLPWRMQGCSGRDGVKRLRKHVFTLAVVVARCTLAQPVFHQWREEMLRTRVQGRQRSHRNVPAYIAKTLGSNVTPAATVVPGVSRVSPQSVGFKPSLSPTNPWGRARVKAAADTA
jgi:hypothetical protein